MSPVRSRLPAPTFKPASRRAFLDVGHGWRYTPSQNVSDWSRYANSARSAPRVRPVVIVLGGPLGSQPRGESRAVLFSQPPAAGSLCVVPSARRGGGGVTWPEDWEKRRFRCCPDWTRSTIFAPSRSF